MNRKRSNNARTPQQGTMQYWMESLNIHDAHTLQSVSSQWQSLAKGNYSFFNKISIKANTLANPLLFDDDALLRTVQMSGKYLKSLHLSGLHSLVLERRSTLGLYMKDYGAHVVSVAITDCNGINTDNQIGSGGWINSLPKLKELKLEGCGTINLRRIISKLPTAINLDIQNCEKPGCHHLVGGDTTCHCTLEQVRDDQGAVHVQNTQDFGNKKFCSSCMKTNRCSNCDLYFCNEKKNKGVLECTNCNLFLCATCNLENRQRVHGGEQKKNDWKCCEDVESWDHESVQLCSLCVQKCPCGINLCQISDNYHYREGEYKNVHVECNELKSCQYCDQKISIHCKSVGHCGTEVRVMGGWKGCYNFTCSSCTDQMIKCDMCERTRCSQCIDDSNCCEVPRSCHGCKKTFCGGTEVEHRYRGSEENPCVVEPCIKCQKMYCYECTRYFEVAGEVDPRWTGQQFVCGNCETEEDLMKRMF